MSTIPTAVHQDDFVRMVNEDRVPNPAVVVCFCTIGLRSGLFAKKWADKFPASLSGSAETLAATASELPSGVRLLNLKGSLLAWTHEGG